jgi:hypothetical protein
LRVIFAKWSILRNTETKRPGYGARRPANPQKKFGDNWGRSPISTIAWQRSFKRCAEANADRN